MPEKDPCKYYVVYGCVLGSSFSIYIYETKGNILTEENMAGSSSVLVTGWLANILHVNIIPVSEMFHQTEMSWTFSIYGLLSSDF